MAVITRALLLAVVLLAPLTMSSKIKHVVVVMLENRSFDHRLGWFHQTLNPEIDGLTGQETNALNVSNPTQGTCNSNDQADPNNTPNGGHSYHATLVEQYGSDTIKPPYPKPLMNGFAFNEHNCDVMHAIPVDQVPVTQSILENFAVVDRYYASFPGPTEVNRMFLHSATSHGYCDNPSYEGYLLGFPQESLMHRLAVNNVTFGVYMQDDVSTTLFFRDQRNDEALKNYHTFDKFIEDAANGTLPSYTLIEPRYTSIPGFPATDEHPSGHDIYQGEMLYKTIYDALRASPLWNESALFITYDEHGGLYDHVPSPVTGVPPPSKDLKCTFGGDAFFDYTRLGVRVPMYIISPWISKNLVVHEPTAASQYEHSSVPRTVQDIFVSPASHLTSRDEWAASFAPLFDALETPRDDCPMTMPMPPKPTAAHRKKMLEEWMQPPNDWQISLAKGFAAVNGVNMTDVDLARLRTEHDVHNFLSAQYAKLRASVGL